MTPPARQRPATAIRMLTLACLALAASPAFAQGPRPDKPDDARVRRDVWGDGAGKLALRLTEGKTGELEWDARTQTWTFQRGFIVTRQGDLPGMPDARLEVGGLAVYRMVGGQWTLQKLLTTFNRYSGIPSPDNEELIAIARENADRVFRQRLRDMPEGLEALRLSQEVPVKWHNANSLSYYLDARYTYRIPSNGQQVPCTTLWEVRIYRDSPQSPWKNPVGMYRKIVSGCTA